jgi:hypothetical protein
MSDTTVVLHNLETGEIIERQMNAAELKQAEKDKAASLAEATEAQTKAAQKADLLDRLGITEAEAKLLLA